MAKIIQNLYGDNVLGKLTDARYLKLPQEYGEEQAEISRLVASLERYGGKICVPLQIGRSTLNQEEPAWRKSRRFFLKALCFLMTPGLICRRSFFVAAGRFGFCTFRAPHCGKPAAFNTCEKRSSR